MNRFLPVWGGCKPATEHCFSQVRHKSKTRRYWCCCLRRNFCQYLWGKKIKIYFPFDSGSKLVLGNGAWDFHWILIKSIASFELPRPCRHSPFMVTTPGDIPLIRPHYCCYWRLHHSPSLSLWKEIKQEKSSRLIAPTKPIKAHLLMVAGARKRSNIKKTLPLFYPAPEAPSTN